MVNSLARMVFPPRKTPYEITTVRRDEEGRQYCYAEHHLLLAGHPRCSVCTILIGPGHLENSADRRGRCGNCSERKLRPSKEQP